MKAEAYANLARRTEVNVYDVFEAFGDLGVNINEMYLFQQGSDEIPFVHGMFMKEY